MPAAGRAGDVIPQPLTGDPCQIAPAWGISLTLAQKLNRAAVRLESVGLGVLLIISGFRTCEQQEALERQGRLAAPCDRSTHTTCPATGADVWLASAADSDGVQLTAVAFAESVGLRVGGGGPVRANGLPLDWNHWDLGPRPTHP